MFRKLLLTTAVAALGIGLSVSSLAGEVKGNGGRTPIGTYIVIAALCAFSGLEDANNPVVPGDTQTPHEEGGNYPPPGAAQACSFLNPGHLFKS